MLLPLLAGAPAADAAAMRVTAEGGSAPLTPHHAPVAAERRQSPAPFTLVALPDGAAVHARPGGTVLGTAAGATPLGAETWLWVVDTARHGRWGRVLLPWRPNGSSGWIALRGHTLVRTRTWLRADVSRRRLWLLRGTHVVASFPAGVGGPQSPTPTGRFTVTDEVATGDAAGPFGWFAFGLSGHQPHLPPGWGGGDQLAIHGTNDPSSIGRAASAGCLHVSARALAVLRRAVRLGTPVVIER